MDEEARPDPWKDDYLERVLDSSIPELVPYLRPGIRVLDIGCGPGNMTLDVAASVKPGEVVGIDKNEDFLATARGLLDKRSIGNASFALMETHSLEFPDSSFDLVFSNTVMHSVIDPVGALREQRRVTKNGGWVIASGVRDWEITTRYPPCPAMGELWAGWIKGFEAMAARKEAGETVDGWYLDLQAGRKCLGWFAAAGLRDVRVKLQVEHQQHFPIKHSGSERWEVSDVDLLPTPEGQKFTEAYDYLFKGGFLDPTVVERAEAESRAWYKRKDAVHYFPAYFVAGRA